MTAALYVDVDRGPYVDLLGRDSCWGVDRDAKTYAGPGPVVAHPPCGPWGRMRRFCTRQDKDAGRVAVRQVLRFGGVLEHPEASLLWQEFGLPRPFSRVPAFVGPVWSLSVRQVRWGHPATKPTWLLFSGISPRALPPFPPPRRATHLITTSRSISDGAGGWLSRRAPCGRPKLDSRRSHLTPPDFARWLISCLQAAE